jgi:hypothetical protein
VDPPLTHHRDEAAGAGRADELRHVVPGMPTRSPRRTCHLHTEAARLLVLGARVSSSTRLNADLPVTCWRGPRHGSAACTPPWQSCW